MSPFIWLKKLQSVFKKDLQQIFLISILSITVVSINNYVAHHTFYYPHAHVIYKSNCLALFITLFCLSIGRLLGTVLLGCYLFLVLICGLITWVSGDINANMLLAIASSSLAFACSMLKNYWGLIVLLFVLTGICIKIISVSSRLRPIIAAVSFILAANNLYHTITYVQDWVPRWLATDQTPDGYGLVFSGHMPGPIGLATYAWIMRYYVPAKENQEHTLVDRTVLGSNSKAQVSNIILVIGESSVSNHQELEGYPVSTTPYILSLNKSGYLCSINHSHSSGNMTNLAVPQIVSFKTPDHPERLDTEKNIIEMANLQKWNTYWFDEQGGGGPYGKDYAFISKYSGTLIRSGESIESNKGYHITGGDDLELIDILSKAVTTPSKNFIVLHLWGSHGGYADRYDDIDNKAIPNASDYDKSIHHTDRVLEKVIQVAQQKFGSGFVLVYLSDHGEDLTRKLHGLTHGSIDQYKIPVFITSADKGVALSNVCKEANELRTPRGDFPQTSVKYLLLELLGFKLDQQLIKQILTHDHVLHSNNKVYAWPNVPTEHNDPIPLTINPQLP